MATTNTTTTVCATERVRDPSRDPKRDSYISLINGPKSPSATTPPAAEAPPPSQKGDTTTLTSSPRRRMDSKRYSSNPLSTAIPIPTTSRERKRHSTPPKFPTTAATTPTSEYPPLSSTPSTPKPPFATPSSPSKRDSYISLHSVLCSPSLPIISSLNRQCRHDSDYARLLEETSRHSSEAWRGDELTRFPTFVRGKAPIPPPPPPPKKKNEGKKIWKEKGKKACVLQ
jgi:hypothetical protein